MLKTVQFTRKGTFCASHYLKNGIGGLQCYYMPINEYSFVGFENAD